MNYEIHEFRGSYWSFFWWKMAKSAISEQNLCIGTGTESGYQYPYKGKWYRYQKLVVPIPIHRKGLVSVLIKVVPIPMLLVALIFVPLHY